MGCAAAAAAAAASPAAAAAAVVPGGVPCVSAGRPQAPLQVQGGGGVGIML
jgi:hypothetical protein